MSKRPNKGRPLGERDMRVSTRGPSIRIPHESHAKIEAIAADRGVSMAAVVEELIAREHEAHPPKHRRRKKRRAPRLARWTAATVIAAIQERQTEGLPVNSWAVQMADAGLWEGGCRVFGSWAAVLEASGTPVKPRGAHLKGLRARRIRAGLTQLSLAHLAGLSQATIANMESERYMPSPESATAVAWALGCGVSELMEAPAR